MVNAQFRAFLKSLPSSICPILGPAFSKRDYCHIDLSVSNKALDDVDVSSAYELGNYVDATVKKNKAKVAFGGYLEKRGIYDRSTYFKYSNSQANRNIHLGLDLWIDEGTAIYGPLDGVLHSFKNNTNFGDYGPCIIIQHQFEDILFYTLYGHLSLDSLIGKQVGQTIKNGSQIATLGSTEVNGSYPPHLHFQIVKDLQGNYGDYPGVSNVHDLEFYKRNCPDPNLLLGL